MQSKHLLLAGAAALFAFALQQSEVQAAQPDFNVGYVNYVPGYGIAVFDQPNGHAISGKYLATGTSWKVFDQQTVNNQVWYNLGGKQWVSGAYLKATPPTPPFAKTVGTVQYVPGYGIAVWNSDQPNRRPTGQVLAHGTRWQVLGHSVVNGEDWYNLGGNQWVAGQYLRLANADSLKANADSLLNNQNFSGVALAYSHGKVVFQQGYGGNRDLSTLYPMYSQQKQVTAVIIAQLVAAGKLTYDTPVSQFYPQLPNAKSVTIRQLLTHTSGYKGTMGLPDSVLDEASAITWVLAHINANGVQGAYDYQDANYTVLAGIIAQISQTSYATQVQTRILQPLGLSGVISNTLPANADPLCTSGQTQTVPSVMLSTLVGAGNLWMTAHDVFVFEKAMDGQLLTAAQFSDLTTVPSGSIYASGMWFKENNERRVHGAITLTGGNSDMYYWGSYDGQSGVVLVGNQTNKLDGDNDAEQLFTQLP